MTRTHARSCRDGRMVYIPKRHYWVQSWDDTGSSKSFCVKCRDRYGWSVIKMGQPWDKDCRVEIDFDYGRRVNREIMLSI
jgi:hypothetical protein